MSKVDFAIELRKKNFSLAQIAEKLSISKSTASLWLRKYPLNESILKLRSVENGLRLGKFQRDLRIKRTKLASDLARKEIGSITDRDLLMLGIALYVGEGTKWQNLVRIVNSDPKVIRLAIKWLEKICKVSKANIFIRIHGYPDTDFRQARIFWSRETGISHENFQSNVIDKRSGKSSKRGSLPYGTAHLNVVGDRRKDVNLGLTIRKWMEVVLD